MRRSVQRVEGRLEFETLVADLSSGFINLPTAEVDGAIQNALRSVCEFLRIDYAVLWQWPATVRDVLVATHSYPDREGPRSPASLGQEQYPWVVEQVRAGRMVVIPATEEMPAAAAVDQEHARRAGIKSNLTVPLSVGGEQPLGALAFNTLRVHLDWPDELVTRLQLVAQVFASALARKRSDDALRESKERLSLAADSAEAGLWVLDFRTGVFWATERARTIFGYASHDVIDMEQFKASVHPDDWGVVSAAVERSASAGERVNVEYRILPPGGGVRWVASRGRPRSTPAGEPDRLMGVSIDITERRRDQDALRASEARVTAGAELAGLGFYELDFGEGVARVDDRFRELVGLSPDAEEVLPVLKFWTEHLHPDDRRHLLDAREQLHDGRLELLSLEYRFLHPTRGLRWLHHLARVATRDAEGRRVKVYGVIRDVTERKRVEDELHELSRRLIRAHEDERAMLARELHDDVSQRLAVLAIDVGRAELAAPDGAQAGAMQAVREGLARLSEDIHSLAYQLHPSILEELGLAEALRAECERWGRQGRLDLSLDLDPLPAAVGTDAALCLFRVAQEALTNVSRHAEASAASVTLRQMDGALVLAVSDDGVGFDPESPEKRMSLGLASMRERVRLVAGTLDIESAPGRGTTIVAWAPVEGGSR